MCNFVVCCKGNVVRGTIYGSAAWFAGSSSNREAHSKAPMLNQAGIQGGALFKL